MSAYSDFAERLMELRRQARLQDEKERYGQYARQYGKVLSPNQPKNAVGVSAEQMQFCHRHLRRQVPTNSLVGLPAKRTILGKVFVTACERDLHSIKTDEWRIDYRAINSPKGWRYHLVRFDGDRTTFANDLILVRTTR